MNAEQCRMGRAALNWTIDQLSHRAGVNRNTLAKIERGGTANTSTLNAIRLTLEAAGVIFIEENGDGPGVRLKRTD